MTEHEPQLSVGLTGPAPEFRRDPDGLYTVSGVRIGDGFHWERDRTFRYAGHVFRHNGRVINRIGLEEYLKSVISSEMSATSSLELLKAHAVISRSWVMAQMRTYRDRACKGLPVEEPAGDIIQWFDRDDHVGFDVCSDDHCQRYQGVTRQTSPAVAQAVEATRGQVLITADGEIADARFSKCCGGAFELFETCWEPRHHAYLAAGADAPAGGTPLPDLTDETEARRWILGRPEAYCNCEDSAVLAQVLNDFDRETTPDFYRWEVTYSVDQLSELIARRSGIDFGRIIALNPKARGTSGRISRLEIHGTKRRMTVGKELIIRRWLSETHLRSSAFIIDRDGDQITLRGAGWGHGAGLCQIGAAMMAARGHDYLAILRHYYPHTHLSHGQN